MSKQKLKEDVKRTITFEMYENGADDDQLFRAISNIIDEHWPDTVSPEMLEEAHQRTIEFFSVNNIRETSPEYYRHFANELSGLVLPKGIDTLESYFGPPEKISSEVKKKLLDSMEAVVHVKGSNYIFVIPEITGEQLERVIITSAQKAGYTVKDIFNYIYDGTLSLRDLCKSMAAELKKRSK
jgi:hypothetical protein